MIKTTDLIHNPIDVERHHLKDGRWYAPTDTWWEKHNKNANTASGTPVPQKPYFRSITTIPNALSKGFGFERWLGNANSYSDAMEYAETRANIGTIVHILIEKLLIAGSISFDDMKMSEFLYTMLEDLDFAADFVYADNKAEIIKYMMSFHQFYVERRPEAHALEIQLMNIESDKNGYKYRFAGTADFIGSMKCQRGVKKFGYVDWKTGEKYASHQLQAIATKILWDSIYPDTPLNFLADIYLSSKWRVSPNYKIGWMEFKPEAWNTALAANKTMNYLENPGVKDPNEEIKPKFEMVLPTEIILKEEEDDKESSTK